MLLFYTWNNWSKSDMPYIVVEEYSLAEMDSDQ